MKSQIDFVKPNWFRGAAQWHPAHPAAGTYGAGAFSVTVDMQIAEKASRIKVSPTEDSGRRYWEVLTY
jgi:hypothetical protein